MSKDNPITGPAAYRNRAGQRRTLQGHPKSLGFLVALETGQTYSRRHGGHQLHSVLNDPEDIVAPWEEVVQEWPSFAFS